MKTAMEFFGAGRLTDAIAAAIQQVRDKPTDVAARWRLCGFLCFTADLEKAEKHLDLIAQQDPKSAAGAALFRQLLRAETARRQFFAEGRLPEFIGEPSENLRLRLEASIPLRHGATKEAAALLARAEESRPHPAGVADGQPFSDFRDLDDLTASFLEVLTPTGKYYWIGFDQINLIEFKEIKSPRDLVWRQARVVVKDGPDGEVFVAALYPGSFAESDDQLKLGRLTDWRGDEGSFVRGVGQRMLLAGDDAKAIAEIGNVELSVIP